MSRHSRVGGNPVGAKAPLPPSPSGRGRRVAAGEGCLPARVGENPDRRESTAPALSFWERAPRKRRVRVAARPRRRESSSARKRRSRPLLLGEGAAKAAGEGCRPARVGGNPGGAKRQPPLLRKRRVIPAKAGTYWGSEGAGAPSRKRRTRTRDIRPLRAPAILAYDERMRDSLRNPTRLPAYGRGATARGEGAKPLKREEPQPYA